MKKFITSRILRKMLILAILMGGLVFVRFGGNTVAAKKDYCCSLCVEILQYCNEHSNEYKSLHQCLELNNSLGCEYCNPGC
jgi:hypothetical protein